jgi:hypothetical protein
MMMVVVVSVEVHEEKGQGRVVVSSPATSISFGGGMQGVEEQWSCT